MAPASKSTKSKEIGLTDFTVFAPHALGVANAQKLTFEIRWISA
jgi:hypothetical protein